MSTIKSKLKTSGAEFKSAAAAARAQVEEMNSRLAQARAGGDDEARKRHQGRGKLLPRERVETLLDRGTPFLELSPLAAWEMYGEPVPAAGLITGVGIVAGRCARNRQPPFGLGQIVYPFHVCPLRPQTAFKPAKTELS